MRMTSVGVGRAQLRVKAVIRPHGLWILRLVFRAGSSYEQHAAWRASEERTGQQSKGCRLRVSQGLPLGSERLTCS